MQDRDQILKDLRPEIKAGSNDYSAVEEFQTQVLRPLLKFQNPVLIFWFKSYLKKRSPLFNAYSGEEQKKVIRNLIKQEPYVRNSLIPSIAGFFTLEEFAFFLENRKEVNKRIVTLLIQRFQDQIGSLV